MSDRETIPASDYPGEPVDLLASVAIRLEEVGSTLAGIGRDLAMVIGEMRVHSRRLTEHDARLNRVEQKIDDHIDAAQ